MKSLELITIILFLFSCENPKEQTKFYPDSISTKPINSTLYRNVPNEISFSLQPKYRGKFSPEDIEINLNYDCYCEFELSNYETIKIIPSDSTIYVGMDFMMDGQIIGGDFYRIKDPDKPKLYSYQIENEPETGEFKDLILRSYHSANEIHKIQEFHLMFDLTGYNAIQYEIESFKFSIIRNNKVLARGKNSTGFLSEETRLSFDTIELGDILLITDIEYSNPNQSKLEFFNYNVIKIK